MATHSLLIRHGLKAFGGEAWGGHAPQAAEVRTDARRMRVYGVCTSETLDRAREVVAADGVDWSEYERNPIVTVCHGWRDPSKVVARAVIDGRFTPERAGGGWRFGAQFVQSGPNAGNAAEAFALVDSGVLRGVSLGFRFLSPHATPFTAADGLPALRIDRCTPYEITFLPVPCNPDAVVHVVEKGLGGRRLSAHWLSILKPMVPARKSHGFTPPRREKAMPQPTPAPGGDPAQDPAAQGQDQAAADQQPAAPAVPTQKPSIALMLAAEQYTMGFIRFLRDQMKVQENEQMKRLVPALVLHLSQMYRALAQTHQQIQMEDQAFPNLMGHGGMLEADPLPDPAQGFGDGLDGATGPDVNAAMVPGGEMAADPASAGQPVDPAQGDGSGDLFGDDTLLSDDDLNGLDGEGEAEDADPAPAPTDDQPADTEVAEDTADASGPPVGLPGDDEDEDDDEPDGPPKTGREKGYTPEREALLVLLREKGAAAAMARADRLLAAHDAGLTRLYSAADVNVLRWGAANLETAPPEALRKVARWMREKSLEGVTRPAPAKPAPALSPDERFIRDVQAETERLLAAAAQPH